MEQLEQIFEYLASHEGRLLVWGGFIRALGFINVIALGAFINQLVSLFGERGVTPVRLISDVFLERRNLNSSANCS
jgi:hypothetical protein